MQKKVPIRMCVGCRENKPKRELVRVVRDPEGEISVDLKGKKSGKGAYICLNEKCLSAAKKTKVFERTFGCGISPEIYERLRLEIEEAGEQE